MTSSKLPRPICHKRPCCLCSLGAYYYYVTEKGRNYEDTLLDVEKYAKDKNIPYRLCTKIVHSCLLWFKRKRHYAVLHCQLAC